MIEFYRCPQNHVVPFTPQFYAMRETEERDLLDGTPLFEHTLRCSSCEKEYTISELKKIEEITEEKERLLLVIHDVQLFRHVRESPSPD